MLHKQVAQEGIRVPPDAAAAAGLHRHLMLTGTS
jgi:hypothetical protein